MTQGFGEGPQRILLVRHGETTFNAEGRIQGSLDVSELNAIGRSQASAMGRFLADTEANLGHIVVSPMRRARQTLSLVREELLRADDAGDGNMGAPISSTDIVVDEVREIDLWEWQGKLKTDLERDLPSEYKVWKESPGDLRLSGGR
ncbi:unnamed protein product, partial [Phaeothamnion confervicola]